MTKPGDKDWLPYEEHLKLIPKKRMASGVIFLNAKDEILMVKPSYKDSWILPGGIIESFESPEEAAVREVREEIGLPQAHLNFIAVIHSPRISLNDDVMHFYFYGGALSQSEISRIQLQAEELEEFRFVAPTDLSKISKASFVPFIPELLQAIKDQRPILIKNKKGSVG